MLLRRSAAARTAQRAFPAKGHRFAGDWKAAGPPVGKRTLRDFILKQVDGTRRRAYKIYDLVIKSK